MSVDDHLLEGLASQTILHEIARGDLEAVSRLVANGVDVNVSNQYGVTPLMVASLCNWPEIVDLLLRRGADPDARESFFGCTALMFACMSGGYEPVRLLLDKGADVDASDSLERTALAVARSVGNSEAARLLESKGARAGAINQWAPGVGFRHGRHSRCGTAFQA